MSFVFSGTGLFCVSLSRWLVQVLSMFPDLGHCPCLRYYQDSGCFAEESRLPIIDIRKLLPVGHLSCPCFVLVVDRAIHFCLGSNLPLLLPSQLWFDSDWAAKYLTVGFSPQLLLYKIPAFGINTPFGSVSQLLSALEIDPDIPAQKFYKVLRRLPKRADSILIQFQTGPVSPNTFSWQSRLVTAWAPERTTHLGMMCWHTAGSLHFSSLGQRHSHVECLPEQCPQIVALLPSHAKCPKPWQLKHCNRQCRNLVVRWRWL